MNCYIVALSVFSSVIVSWSSDSYIQYNKTYNKESARGRTCILCQQTSPKCCFGNMNITSNCDVTNSGHQIQLTTICHWITPPWKFSAYVAVWNLVLIKRTEWLLLVCKNDRFLNSLKIKKKFSFWILSAKPFAKKQVTVTFKRSEPHNVPVVKVASWSTVLPKWGLWHQSHTDWGRSFWDTV